MTTEEIEAMQAENAALKADKDKAATRITDLEAKNKEQEGVIEQKTKDVVGARRKYRKLDELTDEEKEAMSEADIERKRDSDVLFETQETSAKQLADDRAREIKERREAAVKQFAGDDTEVAAKINEHFDSIRGSESAYTPGEIATFMGTAYNMMGVPAAEPIRAAGNEGGGVAPVLVKPGSKVEGEGFADGDAGKGLATMLGIQTGPPPTA